MRYSLSCQCCRHFCRPTQENVTHGYAAGLHRQIPSTKKLFQVSIGWFGYYFFPLLIYSWNLGTGSKTCRHWKDMEHSSADLWKTLSLLAVPSKILKATTKVLLVFKDPATADGSGKRYKISSDRFKPRALQSLNSRHKQKKKEHLVT